MGINDIRCDLKLTALEAVALVEILDFVSTCGQSGRYKGLSKVLADRLGYALKDNDIRVCRR